MQNNIKSLLITVAGVFLLIACLALNIWGGIPFVLFLLSISLIKYIVPESEEKPDCIYRRRKWLTIFALICSIFSLLLGARIPAGALFLIFVIFLMSFFREN